MKLRDAETNSIRQFLEDAGAEGLFKGKVLDYGCGQQPYRALIRSFGAEYHAYDRKEFPGNVSVDDVGEKFLLRKYWNTIVCTQVIQYVSIPGKTLELFWRLLKTGGHLVMTYPTNWPEVENEDLYRFTRTGMEHMLTETNFSIVEHLPRHWSHLPTGDYLVHGYGVVARA